MVIDAVNTATGIAYRDVYSAARAAYAERLLARVRTAVGDDAESVRQFGVEVVTQLCQTLLDNGAPGIHFYTMNQVEPTRTIYNNLGL